MEMQVGVLVAIIVASVVAACGGVGGILVAIGRKIIKKQLDAKEELEKRRAEDEKEDRQKETRTIIREEIAPMREEICEIKKDVEIHKEGTQAMLRNDLYELSDKWTSLGYAPRDVKQNFENLYQKYHKMGKNGVMDGCHERFMALPDEAPKKKTKK